MKEYGFKFLIVLLLLFFPIISSASEGGERQKNGREYLDSELMVSLVDLEERYADLKVEVEEQKESIDELLGKMEVSQNNGAISYADWAAIILTCVAILVTVLGVLIAILSIWGYRNITKEARNSAEVVSNDASSRIAKEQVENCINEIAKEELVNLIHEGELRQHFEDAIDLIYRRHGLAEGVGGFGFGEYPEFDAEDQEK